MGEDVQARSGMHEGFVDDTGQQHHGYNDVSQHTQHSQHSRHSHHDTSLVSVVMTQDDINREVAQLWGELTAQKKMRADQEDADADREAELATLQVLIKGNADRERARTDVIHAEQIAALQSSLTTAEETATTTANRLSNCEGSLMVATMERDDAKRRLERNKEEFAVLVRRERSLADEVALLRADNAKLTQQTQELASVRTQLAESDAQFEEASMKSAERLILLKQEVSRLQARLSSVSEVADGAETSLAEVSQNLKTASSARASAEASLSLTLSQAKALEEDRRTLRAKVDELSIYKRELLPLAESNAELVAEHQTLRAAHTVLDEAYTALRQQTSDSRGKLATLTLLCDEQERELSASGASTLRWKQKAEEWMSRGQIAEEKIQRLENEATSLEAKHATTTTELLAVSTALSNLEAVHGDVQRNGVAVSVRLEKMLPLYEASCVRVSQLELEATALEGRMACLSESSMVRMCEMSKHRHLQRRFSVWCSGVQERVRCGQLKLRAAEFCKKRFGDIPMRVCFQRLARRRRVRVVSRQLCSTVTLSTLRRYYTLLEAHRNVRVGVVRPMVAELEAVSGRLHACGVHIESQRRSIAPLAAERWELLRMSRVWVVLVLNMVNRKHGRTKQSLDTTVQAKLALQEVCADRQIEIERLHTCVAEAGKETEMRTEPLRHALDELQGRLASGREELYREMILRQSAEHKLAQGSRGKGLYLISRISTETMRQCFAAIRRHAALRTLGRATLSLSVVSLQNNKLSAESRRQQLDILDLSSALNTAQSCAALRSDQVHHLNTAFKSLTTQYEAKVGVCDRQLLCLAHSHLNSVLDSLLSRYFARFVRIASTRRDVAQREEATKAALAAERRIAELEDAVQEREVVLQRRTAEGEERSVQLSRALKRLHEAQGAEAELVAVNQELQEATKQRNHLQFISEEAAQKISELEARVAAGSSQLDTVREDSVRRIRDAKDEAAEGMTTEVTKLQGRLDSMLVEKKELRVACVAAEEKVVCVEGELAGLRSVVNKARGVAIAASLLLEAVNVTHLLRGFYARFKQNRALRVAARTVGIVAAKNLSAFLRRMYTQWRVYCITRRVLQARARGVHALGETLTLSLRGRYYTLWKASIGVAKGEIKTHQTQEGLDAKLRHAETAFSRLELEHEVVCRKLDDAGKELHEANEANTLLYSDRENLQVQIADLEQQRYTEQVEAHSRNTTASVRRRRSKETRTTTTEVLSNQRILERYFVKLRSVHIWRRAASAQEEYATLTQSTAALTSRYNTLLAEYEDAKSRTEDSAYTSALLCSTRDTLLHSHAAQRKEASATKAHRLRHVSSMTTLRRYYVSLQRNVVWSVHSKEHRMDAALRDKSRELNEQNETLAKELHASSQACEAAQYRIRVLEGDVQGAVRKGRKDAQQMRCQALREHVRAQCMRTAYISLWMYPKYNSHVREAKLAHQALSATQGTLLRKTEASREHSLALVKKSANQARMLSAFRALQRRASLAKAAHAVGVHWAVRGHAFSQGANLMRTYSSLRRNVLCARTAKRTASVAEALCAHTVCTLVGRSFWKWTAFLECKRGEANSTTVSNVLQTQLQEMGARLEKVKRVRRSVVSRVAEGTENCLRRRIFIYLRGCVHRRRLRALGAAGGVTVLRGAAQNVMKHAFEALRHFIAHKREAKTARTMQAVEGLNEILRERVATAEERQRQQSEEDSHTAARFLQREEELAAVRAELSSERSEVRQLERNIAEHLAELAGTESVITSLRREVGDIQKEKLLADRAARKLEARVEETVRLLEAKEGDCRDLMHEVEQHVVACKEKDTSERHLKLQISTLQSVASQHAATLRTLEELEQSKTEADKQIKTLTKTHRTLEDAHTSLREQGEKDVAALKTSLYEETLNTEKLTTEHTRTILQMQSGVLAVLLRRSEVSVVARCYSNLRLYAVTHAGRRSLKTSQGASARTVSEVLASKTAALLQSRVYHSLNGNRCGAVHRAEVYSMEVESGAQKKEIAQLDSRVQECVLEKAVLLAAARTKALLQPYYGRLAAFMCRQQQRSGRLHVASKALEGRANKEVAQRYLACLVAFVAKGRVRVGQRERADLMKGRVVLAQMSVTFSRWCMYTVMTARKQSETSHHDELSSTRKELEGLVSTLRATSEEEVGVLRSDLAHAQTRVEEAERQTALQKKDLSEGSAALQAKDAQLRALAEEVATLSTAAERLATEKEQLGKRLKKYQDTCQEAMDETAAVREEHNTLSRKSTAAAQTLTKERDALSEELTTVQERIALLDAKYTDSVKDNAATEERLQEAVRTHEEELQKVNQVVTEKAVLVTELEARIAGARTGSESAEKERSRLVERCDALEACALDTERTHNDITEAKNADIQQLTAQLAELTLEHDSAQLSTAQLHDTHNLLVEADQEKAELIATQTKDITALTEELDTVRNAHTALDHTLNEAREQHTLTETSLQEDIVAKEARIVCLTAEVTSALEAHQSSEAEHEGIQLELTAKVTRLEGELNTLHTTHTDVTQQLAEETTTSATLQEAVRTHEEELQKVNQVVTEKAVLVTELEARIAGARTGSESAEKERSRLIKRCDALEACALDTERTHNDITEAKNADIQQLTAQLAELTLEHDSARLSTAQLHDTHNLLVEADQEKAELIATQTKDITALTEELDTVRNAHTALDHTLNEAREQHTLTETSLQEDIEAKEARIVCLTAEVTSALEAHQSSEAEHEGIQLELTAKVTRLEGELNTLHTTHTDVTQQLAEETTTSATLRTELADSTAETARLSALLLHSGDEMSELHENGGKFGEYVRENTAAMSTTVQELQEVMETTLARAAELEEELTASQSENGHLAQQIAELERSSETLQTSITALRHNASEKEDTTRRMEEELHAVKTQKAGLRASLDVADVRLLEAQEAATAATAKAAAIQTTFSALQTRVETAEQKHKSQEASLRDGQRLQETAHRAQRDAEEALKEALTSATAQQQKSDATILEMRAAVRSANTESHKQAEDVLRTQQNLTALQRKLDDTQTTLTQKLLESATSLSTLQDERRTALQRLESAEAEIKEKTLEASVLHHKLSLSETESEEHKLQAQELSQKLASARTNCAKFEMEALHAREAQGTSAARSAELSETVRELEAKVIELGSPMETTLGAGAVSEEDNLVEENFALRIQLEETVTKLSRTTQEKRQLEDLMSEREEDLLSSSSCALQTSRNVTKDIHEEEIALLTEENDLLRQRVTELETESPCNYNGFCEQGSPNHRPVRQDLVPLDPSVTVNTDECQISPASSFHSSP